jgi:predicted dehydrogenase
MLLDFANYWRLATLDVPLVIIGGGRWGRTWASVVAAARGSGKNITMAARTNTDAVRAWAGKFSGLRVAASLAEALESQPRPMVAIVASRPLNHVSDALASLQSGLHVLVEKPISVDVRDGRFLITAARDAGLVLAVGIEFAYLPALHQVAKEIAGRRTGQVELQLRWEDAVGEFRHGATKVRHDEVCLLQDLLPHAFSIFQVFASGAALHIVDAGENEERSRGRIEFRDDLGNNYEFLCDVAAVGRQRVLDVGSETVSAKLDFGGYRPSILLNGCKQPLDPQLATLTSTLRLELGAFLAVTTGRIEATYITSGVPALLALQAKLERAFITSLD